LFFLGTRKNSQQKKLNEDEVRRNGNGKKPLEDPTLSASLPPLPKKWLLTAPSPCLVPAESAYGAVC
jgi:hypothetical protein